MSKFVVLSRTIVRDRWERIWYIKYIPQIRKSPYNHAAVSYTHLYYKLNTNGSGVTSEQTDYNSLNGTVIQAKSITADKVAVTDLVAFGADIGGNHIGHDCIYSGAKTSALNTTRGFYLGSDGQVGFGDTNEYIPVSYTHLIYQS